MPVVNQLRRRDTISSIVIEGDLSSLFERRRELLDKWNVVLDAKFPDLRPAL
jgi:hypothetical protein